MNRTPNFFCNALAGLAGTFLTPVVGFASEANIRLPEIGQTQTLFGSAVSGESILYFAVAVTIVGMFYGLLEFFRVKKLPAHRAMLEVSELIYETCKTYLVQQGKFIAGMWALVAVCIYVYFGVLEKMNAPQVLTIIFWSVLGILGSIGVSLFGIRINNYANSRAAFASLSGKSYSVMSIPLRSGMSIGMLLISVELFLLTMILLLVDPANAGACFIGFAIGESLGASALRICGGIFTKIADIGADLMKIVFNIKEDDARNPGVIADCAGDNAGDSIGPTADGFETYGVTFVALISFIVLAVGKTVTGSETVTLTIISALQAKLIVWLFGLSAVMILTSLVAYYLNDSLSRGKYENSRDFDFEAPMTSLIWWTSLLSIAVTFVVSYGLLADLGEGMWWKLATIIGCGILAGALIPEFTKVFTSSNSKHVTEIVSASREGGASLNILSGLVAGNFSAFWKGMTIALLMVIAYSTAKTGLEQIMIFPGVFAFGLLAFGFLGMGPVTIAVDSFGPVSDNAQSVFELSTIETLPGASEEIEKAHGFRPDFEGGKLALERGDSAGNTFKATSKPVLIGTAVIGATTMIFSIILNLNLKLDLLDPKVLLGLIAGGSVIYWFTGASIQAVTTGAYRAVEFIKANIKLDGSEKASVEDSKKVVQICTQFAQKGMINIFGVIFCLTLAFACFDATFFASYLVSIAVFGLFQAMFMANAGGAWDNAKKVVEVELRQKGTPLHAATVVGDTVGDPYKDTSSVALNPIIKFTTLFGLLAVEIAVTNPATALYYGIPLFLIGLFFVWRSFYGMRILTTKEASAEQAAKEKMAKAA
jgi:K(+)-stimulated pyrophosphate-energized sodium pump